MCSLVLCHSMNFFFPAATEAGGDCPSSSVVQVTYLTKLNRGSRERRRQTRCARNQGVIYGGREVPKDGGGDLGEAFDRSYFKSRRSGEPDGHLVLFASGINRAPALGRPSGGSTVHSECLSSPLIAVNSRSKHLLYGLRPKSVFLCPLHSAGAKGR